MNDKNILLELKYNFFGRIFRMLFYMFGIIISILLFNINLFSSLVAAVVFTLIVYIICDMCFFERVIFTNYHVIKEWRIFGKSIFNKIKYKDLIIEHSQKIHFGSGLLIFYKSNYKGYLKKIFKRLFFFIELAPINKNDIKKIREILIEKKILKGDEYDWKY
ncbi:hypothetical protein ACNSOO_07975 [Aliarcobacter lanthieri]|uniref:hypothetical protein n=1 Tax=Aliarcobacter lanthieri TaxID=1355374 RepID=UPI003AB0CA7A